MLKELGRKILLALSAILAIFILFGSKISCLLDVFFDILYISSYDKGERTKRIQYDENFLLGKLSNRIDSIASTG